MMRLLALVLVGLGVRLGDELGEWVDTHRRLGCLSLAVVERFDGLPDLLSQNVALVVDAIGTPAAPQEDDEDPRTDNERPTCMVEQPASCRIVVEQHEDGPDGKREKYAANQDVHGLSASFRRIPFGL